MVWFFSNEHVRSHPLETSVKAIWNFAHTDLNLKLPKDVIVENVHLSESLMRLSYNLTRYEAEHPKNN